MSRRPFLARLLTGVSMVLVFLGVAAQRSTAQPCMCFGPDVVQRISICTEGQTRAIDLTFCIDSYCPAQPYPGPCGGQPVNARVIIRKICPVGWTATNINTLLISTIAGLGVCCSGNTYLPACTLNTDYVLLVSSNKCWTMDPVTSCWAECTPLGPCCSFFIRYQPGVPTAGECLTTILDGCTDPGTCSSPGCETQICTLPGGPICCF